MPTHASLLGCALLLLACGSEGQPPPPERSETTPAAPAAEPAPAEPAGSEPEAPDEAARAIEPDLGPATVPPGPAGLPEFTRGPPIRLDMLEIAERVVDGERVQSVVLPDAASRARLDERLARPVRGARRCRVLLAVPTFVSQRCDTYDPSAPPSNARDHAISHHVIGDDGALEGIDVWDLFHPGASETRITKLLLRSPDAGQHRAVFTRAGIELTRPWDEEEPFRVSWRAVAPYVRADSVLGPILAAQGLPLAPVGTPMPADPPTAPTIPSDGVSSLLSSWERMSPELRARARLVHPPGLVFPPETNRAALEPHAPREGLTEWYYVEPMGRVAWVRTKAEVPLRVDPGPRAETWGTLPAGAVVPAAIGTVDRVESGTDANQWTYVKHGAHRFGWVRGREVEEVAGPDAPGVEPAE